MTWLRLWTCWRPKLIQTIIGTGTRTRTRLDSRAPAPPTKMQVCLANNKNKVYIMAGKIYSELRSYECMLVVMSRFYKYRKYSILVYLQVNRGERITFQKRIKLITAKNHLCIIVWLSKSKSNHRTVFRTFLRAEKEARGVSKISHIYWS